MPTPDIARCMLTIETTPTLRQYGWVVRGATTHDSLPFRSPAERSQFLGLLAAYAGLVVAPDAVDALAALLCLYRGDDEVAAHLAACHLDAEYAGLLSVTPLEEVDAMVGLFLEEAALTAGHLDGEGDDRDGR